MHGGTGQSRLSDYRNTFQSRDLDEVQDRIGHIFKPHTLRLLGKRQSLNAQVGWTDFGDFSFVYVHHGANVNVYPGKLETFYLLQVPINACGRVRINNAVMEISSDMSYVVSPTFDVEMTFSKDCGHFILTVDKVRLETFLERSLRRSITAPLEFSPIIDMKTSRGQGFVSMINYINGQLNQPGSNLRHDMVRPRAEALILSNLLTSLDHNYYAELTQEVAAPKPYYIKKAQGYIHEHIEQPISPEDLARYSCVSLRSIYSGFQHYLNTSPMMYIKKVKLEKVHQDLMQMDRAETSISEVALKYGFSHFGNFASDYRKRFGELPSETLYRRTYSRK